MADSLVKNNYTIAEFAQSLFKMSEITKKGNYSEAEKLLNFSIVQTYVRYPNMQDKGIGFILDIVQDYQRNLRTYNRDRNYQDCETCPRKRK